MEPTVQRGNRRSQDREVGIGMRSFKGARGHEMDHGSASLWSFPFLGISSSSVVVTN